MSYCSEERDHGYGALEERSPERSAAGDADASSLSPVTRLDRSQQQRQGERTRPAQKKSKMHQCTICLKWLPRPSGLATYTNSHSGAKREYGLYFERSSPFPPSFPLLPPSLCSLCLLWFPVRGRELCADDCGFAPFASVQMPDTDV